MSGKWSKELEPHPIASALEIVDPASIEQALEATKEAAKDTVRVKEILANAVDRAFLKGKVIPSADPQHEYVQGLNIEEAATLLNLDPLTQPDLMEALYNTALSIKERIYGNRIVLFAPLYLSNYCVNSCTYCAFRGKNKHIPRSMLTKDQLIAETEALQKQGHRRLLMLTGEHPKYPFEDFLDAINTVASVKTDPCGSIRRINVEIPALSVSDLRRLKATNHGKEREHYWDFFCLRYYSISFVFANCNSPHIGNSTILDQSELTLCFKKRITLKPSRDSIQVAQKVTMNIAFKLWTALKLQAWTMLVLEHCSASTIIDSRFLPCCSTRSI